MGPRTTEAATRLPAPGTVLAGSLRIERIVGQGAISVVFEATDLPLGRKVAVKFLSPEYARDPEQRARFMREAGAAASMTSEHVARLIDVRSLDDGTAFLVLEYLDGLPLDEILEREGAPAIDVAVDWMLQAIDGVAEAHAQGLVHRDIKPANLFLAERVNRPSIVKVLDFGTVKDTNRRTHLTQTGATLGSPAYMAPEQIRADDLIDPRTDVWALGVTLYELVTGDLPWPSASIPGTLSAILNQSPTPMHQLRSDVPIPLEQLVMRCLSKDREARFSNAGELHGALAAVRATMPKTSMSTRTVRLAAGIIPRGNSPSYNEDMSAVRPRIVLPEPLPPAPPPSRARAFLLAAIVGVALATALLAIVWVALRR